MVTATVERKKSVRQLANEEQETIINFNKDSDTADVFTYEKTWQRHLENDLKLKPIIDNGFGGKSYQMAKGLISMPRKAKRQYSEQTKKKMAVRLAGMNRKQPALL